MKIGNMDIPPAWMIDDIERQQKEHDARRVQLQLEIPIYYPEHDAQENDVVIITLR